MPSSLKNAVPTAPSCHDAVRRAGRQLYEFCQGNNWAGYDPYDALNSRLFRALPFLDWKLARLVMTQGFKWMPLNLRPLFLVPRVQNPKGLALFISALLRLEKTEEAVALGESLLSQRSADPQYWNWGYSFPWQTRTRLVPRHEPNLVCTVFAAEALLDLFEKTGDERFLAPARSSGKYLTDQLIWRDNGITSLCYPLPGWKSQVHNANFLGASLLCRLDRLSGEQAYQRTALEIARYSASCQQADGSWVYGEASSQHWIDSFHTGFNLCALDAMSGHLKSEEFSDHIRKGLHFYLTHFFEADGAPKYFDDRKYPLDVHSAAQALLTLTQLNRWDSNCAPTREAVCQWTLQHLWDERGFFSYQKRRFLTVRIPYMRWGQAWMLLALSHIISEN